jgi:BirA family biotin operon repressor/biotin-[acetyl-CoA-carboxylase] ligase
MQTVVRDVSRHAVPFGREVHAHVEVTSTNDLAARLAADGAPEGTVVLAATQTRGRGRRGATFHSPPDTGLYLSTILRPVAWPSTAADPAGVVAAITLMAGVAVVETAHAVGVGRAELKWPNDVIVPDGTSRGWRKLAGVLTEASADAAGQLQVVLGVGINVRAVPSRVGLDDVATSLTDAAGRPVTVEETLAVVLQSLARVWRLLALHGRLAVVEAWRRHAPSLAGRTVVWREGAVSRTGVARGVDDTGALCVDTAAGQVALVAGDVAWERRHA